MKRTVALVAGLAALGVMGWLGSRLSAQQGAAPARPAAPQTRIALLNLNYVIKGYKKYQNFQNEFKAKVMEHENMIKAKATQAETLAKDLQNPSLDATKREAMEKQIRDLKRDVEDMNASARQSLAKLNDEQMVILFKEVRDAAQRHAMANNFELVLHYNDATTQAEYDSAPNIARKMHSTGCMPMYWAQGMDISADVMHALNTHYSKTAPATTPAAGGGR